MQNDTVAMTVYFRPEQAAALRKAAHASDQSVSRYVRQALAKTLVADGFAPVRREPAESR